MNWHAIATFLADSEGRPLIAVDATGTVRLFNRAAERLLGWARDEVIGERWEQLVDPAGRPAFAAALDVHGPREVPLRSVNGDRVVGEVVFFAVPRGRVGVVEAHDEHARTSRNRQLLRDQLELLARRHALSKRERQVLDHLARGDTAEDIGQALGITPRTAKFHQANVLAKLGLDSRVELISLLLEPAGQKRRR